MNAIKTSLGLLLVTFLAIASGFCFLTCVLALVFSAGSFLSSAGVVVLSGFGAWVCGSACAVVMDELTRIK